MPLSVQKMTGGPVWPLGAVIVPTSGTPVCIMHNIDANNNSAPETATYPGNAVGYEFTPTLRGLSVYGLKPGANNNGLVLNAGNIYLLTRPAGNGSGNRTDSGSIIAMIGPGQTFFYPPEAAMLDQFSPYSLFIDADSNNDGGLCVGWSPMGA